MFYFNLLNFISYVIVIAGYMKILLRAFNIDIEDVKNTLPAWKAKPLLKQNVTCDLTPYQIFRFYQDFGIKDTSEWGDLSYEEAEQLLKKMKNKEDMSSTSVTSTDTNIPPLLAPTRIEQNAALPTPRPKNKRRS